MGGAFKEAGKNASAMQEASQSMDLMTIALKALAPIFKAFEPILSIFNAMFTAFSGALTAQLIPALQPLFAALIDMIPIFMHLGTIVGKLAVEFLTPLISIIVAILPPITALILSLIQTEGFIVVVKVALMAIGVILGLLVGPIGLVIGVIVIAITVFITIYNVINDVVLPAIGAFIMGIAIMIDAITFGMAGAVNYVNALMGTLPGATEAPPTPLPSGSSKFGAKEFFMLQGGTPLITKTGLFYGHEGEAVTPAGQVGMSESLLQELILETRALRKDKEFRNAFRRY